MEDPAQPGNPTHIAVLFECVGDELWREVKKSFIIFCNFLVNLSVNGGVIRVLKHWTCFFRPLKV